MSLPQFQIWTIISATTGIEGFVFLSKAEILEMQCKFSTHHKTDPVLVAFCIPVIVLFIMPIKYIYFQKVHMEKGTKESLFISEKNKKPTL